MRTERQGKSPSDTERKREAGGSAHGKGANPGGKTQAARNAGEPAAKGQPAALQGEREHPRAARETASLARQPREGNRLRRCWGS